jgi:hypothetical protein
MMKIIVVAAGILLLNACRSDQGSKPLNQATQNSHKVVVKEVIQVREYTYLLVNEGGVEKWLATPPIQAKAGETYYYEGGFEMTQFKSRDLDRTFDRILFLEGISREPGSEQMVSPGATVPKEQKRAISIEPIEGGVTIAELYSNPGSYKGKLVTVKGQVVKYTPEVMGTNWIHIQDGTDFNGKYDLTITSDQSTEVGEIAVFEGRLSIDKDLGFGYFYEILIEEAKLTKTGSGSKSF